MSRRDRLHREYFSKFHLKKALARNRTFTRTYLDPCQTNVASQLNHLNKLIFRFSSIERGQKLLYLNTSMRGYPKGLRAGSDPRKPIISVDEHFENVDCRGITSILMSIEVKTGFEFELQFEPLLFRLTNLPGVGLWRQAVS